MDQQRIFCQVLDREREEGTACLISLQQADECKIFVAGAEQSIRVHRCIKGVQNFLSDCTVGSEAAKGVILFEGILVFQAIRSAHQHDAQYDRQ